VVTNRFAHSRYGAGSHEGEIPPSGYTVKANQRSMKYHLPGSTSYDRTKAGLWFVDTATAEAAGFTRALR
jgi:hypothetical protein